MREIIGQWRCGILKNLKIRVLLTNKLNIIRKTNLSNLYLSFSSHGLVDITFQNYFPRKNKDLLKIVISEVEKFAKKHGKGININIVCETCHSGSWKKNIDKFKLGPLNTYNLLTATDTHEIGVASLLHQQISRATNHLASMGGDANNFCKNCSFFQKILKLMNQFHYSDIITPQGWSSDSKIFKFNFNELLIALKSSTNKEFDTIFAEIKKFLSKSQNIENKNKLLNTLKMIQKKASKALSIKVKMEIAELEGDYNKLLDLLTSQRTKEIMFYYDRPYSRELRLSEKPEFIISSNKTRFNYGSEVIDKKIKLTRNIFRKNPKLINEITLNSKSVVFILENLDFALDYLKGSETLIKMEQIIAQKSGTEIERYRFMERCMNSIAKRGKYDQFALTFLNLFLSRYGSGGIIRKDDRFYPYIKNIPAEKINASHLKLFLKQDNALPLLSKKLNDKKNIKNLEHLLDQAIRDKKILSDLSDNRLIKLISEFRKHINIVNENYLKGNYIEVVDRLLLSLKNKDVDNSKVLDLLFEVEHKYPQIIDYFKKISKNKNIPYAIRKSLIKRIRAVHKRKKCFLNVIQTIQENLKR